MDWLGLIDVVNQGGHCGRLSGARCARHYDQSAAALCEASNRLREPKVRKFQCTARNRTRHDGMSALLHRQVESEASSVLERVAHIEIAGPVKAGS
jgi:hypothetical protein